MNSQNDTLPPALLSAYRILLPILEREVTPQEELTTVSCAESEPPTGQPAPRQCACADDLLTVRDELEGEIS